MVMKTAVIVIFSETLHSPLEPFQVPKGKNENRNASQAPRPSKEKSYLLNMKVFHLINNLRWRPLMTCLESIHYKTVSALQDNWKCVDVILGSPHSEMIVCFHHQMRVTIFMRYKIFSATIVLQMLDSAYYEALRFCIVSFSRVLLCRVENHLFHYSRTTWTWFATWDYKGFQDLLHLHWFSTLLRTVDPMVGEWGILWKISFWISPRL